MLFRINEIGLFQKEKKDILKFNDEINFISGDSNTGKSSIGEIIDYCLGSSTKIPGVKIADEPNIFSIFLTIDSHNILIARNRFDLEFYEGKKYIFIKNIQNIFSLNHIDIDFFHTHESEYITLTDFIELEIPKYFSSFPPKTRLNGQEMVRPTIRNMPSFMFQVQDIIKNKSPLFYKMDTGARVSSIKRDFELFLGLVDYKIYNKVNRKNEIIKALKKLESSNSVYEEEIEKEYFNLKNSYHRLFTHLNRNIDVESLDNSFLMNLENLNNISLEYSIDSDIGKSIEQLSTKVNKQSKIVEDLKIELSNVKTQIQHIDTANFKLQTDSSIKYTQHCPMCDSQIEQKFEVFESAKKKILEEKNFLNNFNSDILREKETETEHKLDIEKNILKGLISQRKKLEDDVIEVRTMYEKQNLFNEIKGMIKKNIETIEAYQKKLIDVEKKEKLEKELEAIEKELKKADIKTKRHEAEYLIGKYSTNMLKTLKFDNIDYGEPNLKFDIKDVTAYQQKEDGKIYYLSNIGSAENNLSFHISVFFGLHQYILEHTNSILPSFIFLDQPSQVYFPKAEDFKNGTGDIKTVESIYKSIIKFIKDVNKTSLFTKIQIIIVDHYYSEEEWYQKYLVEQYWDKDKNLGLIKG